VLIFFILIPLSKKVSKMGYINPEHSTSSRSITKHLADMQEAARKDVERCFGVLQA
jgi:hypothetical protein